MHPSRLLSAAEERGRQSRNGRGLGGRLLLPCHGSKFDYAGRVFRGAPAPTNLRVPPYTFASDNTLVIGEDAETKGA